MRRLVFLALLVGLLAVGTAGAAPTDATPPILTYLEDMTYAEFYMDRWDCTDILESTEDDESGISFVAIGVDKTIGYGDYILHDYEHGDGTGYICLRRAGMWHTSGVDLFDRAGNGRWYSQEELRALGFFSRFWVYKDSHREAVPPKSLRKPAKGKQTGGPAELAADDGSYVTMTSKRNRTDWTSLFSQIPNGARTLTLTFRGQSDVPCLSRLFLMNFDTDEWELLDERMIGPEEVGVTGVGPQDGLRPYVSNVHGPGWAWVRNTCEADGSFTTSTDVLTVDWAAD